jgi:small-conductance mechanosensitive channel
MKKATILILSLCWWAFVAEAYPQQASHTARVEVNGQTFFVLRAGVGSFSPEERAEAARKRLQTIMDSGRYPVKVEVREVDSQRLLMVNTQPILAITEQDARAEGLSSEELARRWAASLQEGLNRAQAKSARLTLLRRMIITGLVILGTLLLLVAIRNAHRQIRHGLKARRERLPALRFRGLELIRAETFFRTLVQSLWLVYGGCVLIVGLGALLLIFAQFPQTRGYALQLGYWIWEPLVDIMRGIVSYLPNLFYILVIVLVTRVILRILALVFDQAARGAISLEPWVHADVAGPTGQIIKTLVILISLFFVAPLLPGTGTRAAQGITIIVGLMVSLGSTSTVGNVIAGVVLTYMRPFKLGDRVKIGEVTGDILERTFLYTRVLTIKNEEVIVPSLQALSTAMVNYSARAKQRGLILHTSVTIGYDAPWREVHDFLLRAADRTRNVLKAPKPFVLQTSLDDFFVTYQLNVFTDQPNKQADIYSELHQNIQDSFNEGGIEIMSPHYFQVRDGNTTTIPVQYRGTDYTPQRFRVEARLADPARQPDPGI